MDQFLREDQKLFKHKWRQIHERTHDSALRSLTPPFLQALRKGCEIVGKQELDYWYERDPILAHYVEETNLNPCMLDAIEKQLAYVRP